MLLQIVEDNKRHRSKTKKNQGDPPMNPVISDHQPQNSCNWIMRNTHRKKKRVDGPSISPLHLGQIIAFHSKKSATLSRNIGTISTITFDTNGRYTKTQSGRSFGGNIHIPAMPRRITRRSQCCRMRGAVPSAWPICTYFLDGLDLKYYTDPAQPSHNDRCEELDHLSVQADRSSTSSSISLRCELPYDPYGQLKTKKKKKLATLNRPTTVSHSPHTAKERRAHRGKRSF